MKRAILSDIHGNHEALTAVLKDIEGRAVDAIVSLGDNVGYGPSPGEVIDDLVAHDVCSVMGNHEKAMFDSAAYAGLNFQAQENNDATRKILSSEQMEYCRKLALYHAEEGVMCVHGFPPDFVNTYVSELSDEHLQGFLSGDCYDVNFVGHTHRLSLISFGEGQFERQSLKEGRVILASTKKYIINAGSVGQPRVKDKRAQYVIWDDLTRELDVRCVEYDAKSCAQKIRNLGWPDVFALRLLPPL